MDVLKIHYPKVHYDPSQRGQVFPLLLPFFRDENFKDNERKKVYGISNNDFSYQGDISKCDLVILTMSWNYYVKESLTHRAIILIESANTYDKMVWIYMSGDFGMSIPYYENIKVFRHGGRKSKLSKNHMAIPVFIRDPISNIYNGNEKILENEFDEIPTVGFCGQADNSMLTLIKENTKSTYRNLKYYFGMDFNSPQPIMSTSYLRYRTMQHLEKSELVKTNFIKRKSYRAGAKYGKERHKTKIEYFDNMTSSNYILCIRGAGNFSVRFYEALSMGRIPVLLDTDCLLPLSDIIDWENHIIRVRRQDLKLIGQKLIDYHKKTNRHELENISKSNRKLWKEKLAFGTYFRTMIQLQIETKIKLGI